MSCTKSVKTTSFNDDIYITTLSRTQATHMQSKYFVVVHIKDSVSQKIKRNYKYSLKNIFM